MYTDIKFLNLLSPRLDKFKQKSPKLWNFRCVICGDSQKNKNKARGFIYETKGTLVFKCHNCGVSKSFSSLLFELDPALYKAYRMEKFQKPNTERRMTSYQVKKMKKIVSQKPSFETSILDTLAPCNKLNNSHPAIEYLLNRKLPIDALYFTEKFREWVNTVKPNTFQEVAPDEARIIIPFIDQEGNVFGFQGRSLSNSGLRYITILLQEDKPKIFGLNKLDYDKTIYICEGPLDSLFLDNCIAMAGADVDVSELSSHNPVFIYDNEPRNKQITSRMQKCIQSGKQIVIWPNGITDKDINEMVLSGRDVKKIIKDNTYSGLAAQLKLNDWKK